MASKASNVEVGDRLDSNGSSSWLGCRRLGEREGDRESARLGAAKRDVGPKVVGFMIQLSALRMREL